MLPKKTNIFWINSKKPLDIFIEKKKKPKFDWGNVRHKEKSEICYEMHQKITEKKLGISMPERSRTILGTHFGWKCYRNDITNLILYMGGTAL